MCDTLSPSSAAPVHPPVCDSGLLPQYGTKALDRVLSTILSHTENGVPVPRSYGRGKDTFFHGKNMTSSRVSAQWVGLRFGMLEEPSRRSEGENRGKCHWLVMSPCQARGGAEFLEGKQSCRNAVGRLNPKMQKMSSAIPEMKQGLISMGICCSQTKYGTVSMEKGTCGAAPAQGRGQMEEMGVSWPT